VSGVVDADLRRALRFIVPYWRRLVLVLAISLISTGLSLWLPLLSRDFFDRALLGRDASSLIRVAVLFTVITLSSFVLNVVSGLRYTRVSADILFDMRLEMYRHLQRLSPRFFARTRMGDVLSRINSDVAEIQRIAAESALAWVGNVLFLAGTTVMLAWLDWRLFLLTIAVAPISLWALVRYRRKLEGEVTVLRQRSADIGSFLIETLQGVRLVVTSNAQAREAARFADRNRAFVSALMSMQKLTYLSGGLPGLLLTAGSGAVFVYGGIRVIDGSMTVGTFVAFMAYQMRFLPPLQALMGLYTNLAAARVSLRRVLEILDAPIEVQEPAAAVSLSGALSAPGMPAVPEVAALPVVRGEVVFDNVSLSFDRGARVLDRLSFSVAPGETLAIVGPSGSGKSTVADLMVRLLDPDEGTITLDGHDLKTVRLEHLRRAVGIVDQEPCILHASIAENIRYAKPDATDDEVRAAARQAALEPFIERLPQGYDTIVGERGAALSAGERQRIATARAFLTKPAVLVLDEPTASLDPIAEREVIAGYKAVMRGQTTIVITHRLDVASRADRIIVLTGARAVEDGSPAELRAKAGRFTELFPAYAS
jgi:ATP-binding cassette subfamily B protein